jgi:hypothetical protein
MSTPGTLTSRTDRDRRAVRFARSLLHLSRLSIERRAAELKDRRISPDDDVAWWEATTALNRAIRRQGSGHQAAMAAHLASQALLAAASRTGLALSPDVTALARSAGEVARLLVVWDLHTAADYLTRGWEDLLPPAAPPAPSGAAGGRGRPVIVSGPTNNQAPVPRKRCIGRTPGTIPETSKEDPWTSC